MNTCTVDTKTFSELPDRSKLTGMPMPNQWYRDPGNEAHVYKWEIPPRGGPGEWVAFLRLEPNA